MSAAPSAAAPTGSSAAGWTSLLSAAADESASVDSASASSASALSSASSSSPSSAHLLYRDVLQSVLSWLPLSSLSSPRLVCARWSAAVRGECAARPLRQKAELAAALTMISDEAAAVAGATRLTRLIRSVPTEDWPRSRGLIVALRSAAELMSADQRTDLYCTLLESRVFDVESSTMRPLLSECLLLCCESASEDQLRLLFQARAIAPLCKLLQSADASTILQSLSVLTRFLEMGRRDMTATGSVNAVAESVEECGGLDLIESLQSHQSEAIYEASVACLDTYFAAEEGDGDWPEEQHTFAFGGNGGFAFQ